MHQANPESLRTDQTYLPMVHSSFISHYLHNINIERKVLQQMITDKNKYSTNYKMCVVVKVAKAFSKVRYRYNSGTSPQKMNAARHQIRQFLYFKIQTMRRVSKKYIFLQDTCTALSTTRCHLEATDEVLKMKKSHIASIVQISFKGTIT